ncbi:kinase suppressor of Ras 2 [Anastrepha obliqua]|uniref:kinase suppressor of Ras 2 n=1 Tax=Anastrepha obliqua TaxID=95512 RepID=UPI00240993EB|nr:kinase suppressor of Ras 2 [Anastrepha obliqua]XP_054733890.1 kinase suppressor of Ras 2 [Anastrepha obliqua]XP_054733898.1 kinase suppressor of Ras 2 [Anastrepha obliqua]
MTSASAMAAPLPVNDLDVIQDMIDISADRLEGLRTQCATSATLTQQEIRSLESKLVRMFSKLLLTKARLNERIPASGLPHTTGTELRQWLRVVGLSQESSNICLTRLSTLEQLLEQSDEELKQLLCNNLGYRTEEDVRRLTTAMQNLRKCKQSLSILEGGNGITSTAGSEGKEQLTEQLFWDSWDRHHPHHHHHHRGSMGNIGITASPRTHRMITKQAKQHHHQSAGSSRQSPSHDHSGKSTSTAAINNTTDDLSSMQGSTLTLTLTPSPPNSPFTPTSIISHFSTVCSGVSSVNGTPQRGKPAGTPPPMKKHQTLLSSMQQHTPTHAATVASATAASVMASSQQDSSMLPLAKSKSNESPFRDTPLSSTGSPQSQSLTAASSVMGATAMAGSNISSLPRSRLHTDPSPDSYSSASSDVFAENNNNPNNLQVPRSPGTLTLGMGHTISHRFAKVFQVMSTCDLCQKQMFFGLKCKECKYRCHKDCESNVPPSCGLPPEFVDEFKKTLKDQVGFPTLPHNQPTANTSPNLNTFGRNRAQRRNKSGSTVSSSHQHDSSSPGSSCNSSSPSSPALFNLQQQHAAAHAGTVFITSGGNMMSSSGGGSSSTSSNMLSTPSSFQKNSSQFNFPDVTITSNCNQSAGGTTQTLYSSQNSGTESVSGEFICSQQFEFHDGNNSLTSSINKSSCGSESLSSGTVVTCVGPYASSTNAATVTASTNSTIHSITSSIVSTGTGSFYPRKLSSAGVDKRAPFSELSDTHKSNDSDKTVSLSGSTSASTDSDRTPIRLDSTEDGDSGNWPRQNSLSLKEWDIPYGDLHLLESIGKGRFGTVHRALWHGDVAVKLLKEDYLDDEHMLEAFKLEVANFKKTRHENLVLFMGACMNPPHLAIVTSLCKGNTLYTYIHARRDKFTINRTTLVAQQISQGMGYLHARGIHHKDLRTKNIFLENGKVIITDFGLFSSTKLLYCEMGLGVPNGWLCYLAPELMRALMPRKPTEEILPFSKASDVYSFGTVWYELLCGEFPFKSQPPESVIWQVGRGMKQTLANLQTSRDVKDILMLCWSFQADDRPDFAKLLSLLERLPKKRLARSPSHPVQLSRSAESVF